MKPILEKADARKRPVPSLKNPKTRLTTLLCLLLGAAIGLLLPLPQALAAEAHPQGPTLAASGVKAADTAADTEGQPGIDVSQWQGTIDFAAVKAAGIEVVYIKAGEGANETDPDFETNYTNAAAAGLKVGFYHYVTARSVEEAEAQAEFFYSLIQGKTAQCRPAMDYESFGNQSDDTVNAIAEAFLAKLEALCGEKPMLYSDEYRARTLWEEALAVYPLWIADYAAENDTDLPSDFGPWTSCAGFQYTDEGDIDGIEDDVDRDVFYSSAFVGHDETGGAKPSPNLHTFTYKVQPGDTLWCLARTYHTSVEVLVSLNNISNPNLILIGQLLKIPADTDCG